LSGAASSVQRRGPLLVLLILAWAVSWPIVKVGVRTVPPIWYGCLRYAIAAACGFAMLAVRGDLRLPSRRDWPLIFVSSTLQMAAFSALTGLALTRLPPGRAAVLAYSTPIWVVPLAAWRLRERISKSGVFGVSAGLLGVLAIAAPSLHRHEADQVLAYSLLIGAAAAWATSIVFVRSHRFAATPLALAPWQMSIAAALLLAIAVPVEGAAPALSTTAAASLAYVGPIGTAFAYWAVVEVGRHVPAQTLSIALLATPCLGIAISAVALGERVGGSLVAGVALIAAGIRLTTKG
jgi:drug/metabolite transporter (DMT)-like permease